MEKWIPPFIRNQPVNYYKSVDYANDACRSGGDSTYGT